MIAVVVFDLDDTLYDEVRYCRSGFAAVADHLATLPGSVPADRIFAAFWRQFSAGNRSNTFNAALDELADPEGDVPQILRKVPRADAEHDSIFDVAQRCERCSLLLIVLLIHGAESTVPALGRALYWL